MDDYEKRNALEWDQQASAADVSTGDEWQVVPTGRGKKEQKKLVRASQTAAAQHPQVKALASAAGNTISPSGVTRQSPLSRKEQKKAVTQQPQTQQQDVLPPGDEGRQDLEQQTSPPQTQRQHGISPHKWRQAVEHGNNNGES
jgi:hypothetical protein